MNHDGQSSSSTLVFLLDVDNTLLNNDRLKEDVAASIRELVGPERADRFWELYEEVRHERDYVDYPGTVQRWEEEYRDPDTGRRIMDMLNGWPFADYVYPHAIEAMQHMARFGTVVILSDGDPVFQPHKIANSGLAAAAGGHVLIYVHKEKELAKVFARYPAGHYVVVDDKARILSALEGECPRDFTTILVMQGKYARPEDYSPKPDFILPTIGDLRSFTRTEFIQAHPDRVRAS